MSVRMTVPLEGGLCDGVGLSRGRPLYSEHRQRARVHRRGVRRRGGPGAYRRESRGGPGPRSAVRGVVCERDGGETLVDRRHPVAVFLVPGWRGREKREAF